MDIVTTISRFHPLLVHLPIGILIIAFVFEILKRRNRKLILDEAISVSLSVSLLSSILAIITGWLLANEGGYNEDMVSNHKWMGICMTIATLFLYLIKKINKDLDRIFSLPLFTIAIILLSITGHYGGSLTHGEDFLFPKSESKVAPIEDIKKAATYSQLIQPILNDKCVSCHNESKAKGELVMTNYISLKKGGESGAIFDLNIPLESNLLQRIHLQETDKKHMPPKGKKQLNNDEIKLLKWWLENKACETCTPSSMNTPDEITGILNKIDQEKSKPTIEVNDYDVDSFNKLQKIGTVIYPTSGESKLLVVNLANMSINSDIMDLLSDLGENIVDLNLSNSNFDDSFADALEDMENLKKLQIQNTKVTDDAIENLENLHSLQSLNVYNTSISDQSIESLEEIENLKVLYTWNSKFSLEGINQLKEKGIQIIEANEDLFAKAQWLSPSIISNTLFDSSTLVEFTSEIEPSAYYYTLDGTTPNKTSLKYEKSISISNSCVMKVIAAKDGWLSSDVIEKQFVKSSIKPINIRMISRADKKYNPGTSTLIDLKNGTDDLTNNWIGHSKYNFKTIFSFETPTEIEQVIVSALKKPIDWIFYPKGFKVSTSTDGINFKRVANMSYEAEESMLTENKFFEIPFEKQKVKYLKIEVINQGKNPSWHSSAGENSWLFIDEIILQ